jgi:hypothetical protein
MALTHRSHRSHRSHRWAASALAALALLAIVAPPASAEAPANDKLRNAIEIPSIPYTNEQSTVDAVSDGPRFCSNNGSVFYRYTATETRRLQADTIGSDYDTVLGVFTGGRFDAVEVACNDDRFGLDSGVRFRAEAGQTYTFMIGSCCGNGDDDPFTRNLVFSLARTTPPEPLTVDVTIDPNGTVRFNGRAELSGTVECSTRSGVEIGGLLRQVQGDFAVRGFGDVEVACDDTGPIPWTLIIRAQDDATFVPGDARFSYSYFAESWDTSLSVRDRVATISLA